MAPSIGHSDNLHTNQSSSGEDDIFFSGDSSSGGIRLKSNEKEMGYQYSAASTGLIESPEALCGRVKLLLTDLFPGTKSPEDFEVEYIGMGAYHKVVGFKVPIPKTAQTGIDNPLLEGGEYVIRLQYGRYLDQSTDMERDVAILNGLAGKIDVPISRVLMFDEKKTNPLGDAYTVATRLPGTTLEIIAEDKGFTMEQSCSMVEQVTYVVEKLTSITAPYPGLIASTHGEGIDKELCPSGIPTRMLDFPFDTLSLTTLADPSPLTFMLALADHWVTYEAAHLPSEDGNFTFWMKIKAIIHALSQHGILGSTFHLVHGDLAARNILGIVNADSTIKITGVVDWDFAHFAPLFCAYRAPLYRWGGGEDDAKEYCDPEELEAFKDAASPEYQKYAFSEEADIARKIWTVLREGMSGEYHKVLASLLIREWEILILEGRVGSIAPITL